MRRPWMKDLKAYRFNRDGTMTQETAQEHREKNSLDAICCRPRAALVAYGMALGVSFEEAKEIVRRQRATVEH